MLKRTILLALIFVLVLGSFGYQTALGNGEVTVYLNGSKLAFEVPPAIISNRTMVPFRAIGEAMGVNVLWFQESRQILAFNDSAYAVMTVGSDEIWINDRVEKIDAPPVIINNRTLVPIRFFSQAFGYEAEWNPAQRRVDLIGQSVSAPPVVIPPAGDRPVKHVLAWYSGQSYEDFSNNLDKLTSTAFMWYIPDKDGNLQTKNSYWGINKPTNHKEIMDLAKDNNVQRHMMIFKVDRDELVQMLRSPQARAKLIVQIIQNAIINGYDGVNIDFENLPPTEREYLNAFMREFYGSIKPFGISVSIAVPAMTERSTWNMAFDYKTLGENSDYVAIMAYDRDPRNPMAQSAMPWVEEITDYALKYVPKEKILLGLGVYGYEWTNGQRSGTVLLDRGSLTLNVKYLAEIMAKHGGQPVWCDTAKMHRYTYRDGGVNRVIWFECDKGIEEKMKYVIGKDLGGVAIWRLGYMTEKTWDSIMKYVQPK